MSDQVLPNAIKAHARLQTQTAMGNAMRSVVQLEKMIAAHVAFATAMRGRAVKERA